MRNARRTRPAGRVLFSTRVLVSFSLALLAGLFGAGSGFCANLGPHSTTVDNPCKVCHDTATGTPALRGWAGSTSGPATGWGSRQLSNLCYLCHQAGGYGTGAHNMLANAFADASHGYLASGLPREPEGSPQGSRYQAPAASGLPYASAAQIECTSCHDAHNAVNRPFNQRSSIQELCRGCHEGRINNLAIRSTAGFTRWYSTHPTARTLGDKARANIKTEATINSALRVAYVPAPDYALGGHLSAGATGSMDCQSCHAVHGPSQGVPGLTDLLALDNVTVAGTADPSLLCEGCHFGGSAGEQVGTLVLAGSDHPVDAGAGRSFYPTGVALPTLWLAGSTPNSDRGAQPFYGPVVSATPVCSSCHDTHGGIAGTPLLRGPQPTAGWGAFSYSDWCFACHTAAQVLPNAHHSVTANLNTALGDAMTSQLSCGDCHGPGATTNWLAHNGFWAWAVPVGDNNSSFCLACHTAADPLDLVAAPALKGRGFTEPASFPATHGTRRGTASHYLGPDSGEFSGVDPKISAWSTAYFSSYGAPSTAGGGLVPPNAAGAIICESCHNTLYNDGRANPAYYTPSRTAGWKSNLLLERYEDDPPGTGSGSGANAVGSALCTGCHTSTGDPFHATGAIETVGHRQNQALITGSANYGYANQATAPGAFSYPNSNQMDCDSCHRPHSADTDSDVSGAAHGFRTSSDGRMTRHILEVDGLNHTFGGTTVCSECHNR